MKLRIVYHRIRQRSNSFPQVVVGRVARQSRNREGYFFLSSVGGFFGLGYFCSTRRDLTSKLFPIERASESPPTSASALWLWLLSPGCSRIRPAKHPTETD